MTDGKVKVTSNINGKEAHDALGFRLEVPNMLLNSVREYMYGTPLLPAIRNKSDALVCRLSMEATKEVFRTPSISEVFAGKVTVELPGGLPNLCKKQQTASK